MTGKHASHGLVVLSHGKDSSPEATKISALTPVAAERGWRTLAPDYRGMGDPGERVAHLLQVVKGEPAPLVLVGSSMGAVVSVFAAQQMDCAGAFLMAPAVFWPGYEHLDYRCPTPELMVVHGWHDDIVAVESGMRLARQEQATLLVLDDDHRLTGRMDQLESAFAGFLDRVERRIRS